MTKEEQIKQRRARMMEHIDRLLLAGQIDRKTYDLMVQDLEGQVRLSVGILPR